MPTYAIGDIQGCYGPFQALLAKANFHPTKDTLWVAGDLVNRGPNNLGVLRFIKNLRNHAKVILGNHDLHLLAVHAGAKPCGKKDTINDILEAPDCEELLNWLRTRPLIYQQDNWVMSHAGIPHIWTVSEAMNCAQEVSSALAGPNYKEFLYSMYGNEPPGWSNDLAPADRLRVITNYLTRMRFIDADGKLNLKVKGGFDSTPQDAKPWFKHIRAEEDAQIQFLFGHWAALEGRTRRDNIHGLDTGCVWGGCLSMLRLEDKMRFSVNCD